MKFYLPILVIALVSVLVISGCSSKPADTVNVLTDVQVTVPTGWESEVSQLRDQVIYFSPVEDDQDVFSENFGVTMELLTGQLTLEEYLTLSIEDLKASLGVDTVTPQSTILAGLPAYKLEYDYEFEDSGYQYDLRVTQIVTIKDNKAYIITYGGEKDKFSQFEPTFQQMLDSFKIK